MIVYTNTNGLLWEQTGNRVLPVSQTQSTTNTIVSVHDFWEFPNETKIQLFASSTTQSNTNQNNVVLYFNDAKQSKQIALEVLQTDTISQIKQKLQEKDTSYSKNIVFISEGGRKLEDLSKTLGDYNIYPGSTIHLFQQNL